MQPEHGLEVCRSGVLLLFTSSCTCAQRGRVLQETHNLISTMSVDDLLQPENPHDNMATLIFVEACPYPKKHAQQRVNKGTYIAQ